ncbi:MAG: hypothetical protein C4334_02680 [Pyrinomonas sp.]|uniref:PilN domain-containing protein n=1 Tax=Pyrinomonas sp. TaxID=2080306 RepID=UPI003317F0CC
MIKINLLNSVTDRPRGIEAVPQHITRKETQSYLLVAVVGALLALGLVFDYISANAQRNAAQRELERQQQIAAQMAAIRKEQAELERKIKETEARIEAIRKLRASQQGPVAVLSAINERLPLMNTFRLESIEQKGGELIIRGDSPSETSVTEFGRSLEFSGGLFSNVNIETQRKALEVPVSTSAGDGKVIQKPETVTFTIKCQYTPPQTSTNKQQNQQSAAGQVAQK